MKSNCPAKKQLTLLVNTCDSYEDLWAPFFSLLKKYWNPIDIPIILNTETKKFHVEDLNITCSNSDVDALYGQRMISTLEKVKTKYVVILLDDFFLRRPVDQNMISQIISWMDEDPNIICFSCDYNKAYIDWEIGKYPGFRRLPPGNNYTLNLQAAIWRTKDLKKYWRPNVNPWEWEELCNVQTINHLNHKFYCLCQGEQAFIDYGHQEYGDVWGVYRGKWIVDDVAPLFKKEGIEMDFSTRGIYDPSEPVRILSTPATFGDHCRRVQRCLGTAELPKYVLFRFYQKLRRYLNKPVQLDYFLYLQERAKKRFLSSDY